MRAKILRITGDDIKKANSNGGPTFSPRGQGRCVCNQLPHLGRLKQTQVRFVKKVCGNPPVQRAKPKVLPSPSNPRYISYGSLYPERRDDPRRW